MLVRLMYASRAAAGFDAEELAAILRASRAANPQHGITGVLCYSEAVDSHQGQGIFLQVLEGGRGAVNRLYNRIVADPRHHDAELMLYEEISERRFAGWAMGQVALSRLNPSLLLKYSERATLDPFAVSGAVSMALFEELVATASVACQG
ncbi:MAG: BLUF domain-containing protein [Betaproteobacteria bacterium]|nr:BLUF domain-containing protein [Betaproteobacteria bacterium]MCC6247562.1 BLUF domain-containing protein [Rubrivivax sp.]MCL4697107.1 BLUF domain-containing protein [Burkholderiaceae bacterium]